MIPKKKFRNSENGKYKKKKKREKYQLSYTGVTKKREKEGNHTCIEFETINAHHETEK